METMDFRHPDPAVDVRVRVEPTIMDNYVKVTFDMFGLRDTVGGQLISALSPWDRSRPVFNTVLYTDTWPGRRLARMAAVGTWMAYINHEALELVRVRMDTTSFIYYDPHANVQSPAQTVVNTSAAAVPGLQALERAARFCFHKGLVDAALAELYLAQRELAIEEGWVRDGEIGG